MSSCVTDSIAQLVILCKMVTRRDATDMTEVFVLVSSLCDPIEETFKQNRSG